MRSIVPRRHFLKRLLKGLKTGTTTFCMWYVEIKLSDNITPADSVDTVFYSEPGDFFTQ